MESSKQDVLIIAHRGACNVAPENSLKAFQKAIELGADYIECDIHQSKDGELIIMHDANILRMTGKNGIIKDMTYAELKQLEIGDGEKIPTLRELIKLTKGNIALNCELKTTELAENLVIILKEANIIESTIVSSFKNDALVKIQKIEPNIKLAALISARCPWITRLISQKKITRAAVKNRFYAVNPKHALVNRRFIKRAHNHNLKVFPWTVDSEKKIRKLIKIGVDGIITNDISKMNKILNQMT